MMKCRECDYIKDEYKKIAEYYKKKGYTDIENIEQQCYCEKVGGKISNFGYCADIEESETDSNKEIETNLTETMLRKRKAKVRRNGDFGHKRKLKWQAKHIGGYPTPAYGVTKEGNYTEDEKEVAYYKETQKSSHKECYKEWKKQTNKKVRKAPITEGSESKQKGLYKKTQKGYAD